MHPTRGEPPEQATAGAPQGAHAAGSSAPGGPPGGTGGAAGDPARRNLLLSRPSALRMAVIYAIAGLTWIVISDHVVGALTPDPRRALDFQLLKGALFVLVTAAVGYVLLWRAGAKLRAAEELRALREEWFEAQYQAIPLPTFTWRRDGETLRLVSSNAAAAAALGAAAAAAGTSTAEAIFGDTAALELLRQCAAEEQSLAAVACFSLPRGAPPRWRRVNVSFVAPDLVLQHVADIHDERVAEEERTRLLARERDAAARTAEILDSIGEGFFALDREGRFVHVNRRAESLLRRSSEDLLGHDIMEIYAQNASAAVLRAYRKAAATGVAQELEGFYSPLGVWLAIRFYPSATGLSVFFSDVSERRRVEQELHRTATLLDTLLEQAPVGFAFFDRDLRCVRVNRRHSEIVGSSPEELLGRRIAEVSPPLPGVDDYLREVLATGRVITRTDRVGLPGRTEGPVALWVRYYPVRGADGELIGVGVVVDDVTAEREAEDRLAHTVALLSATLDSTEDGIIVTDLQGRIIAHNRRFREMSGMTDAQLDGGDMRALRHLVLPLYREPDRVVALAERLLESPEQSAGDVLEMTDGRIVERRSVPHRVNGEVEGRVWSFRDVTEQRQAHAALQESESRFRLMIEGSQDVFFYRHDLDGVYQYLSPSVRAVLGYEPAELLGRTSDLLLVEERSAQEVKANTARALETGLPIPPYSAVNRHRDGRLITLEITETPVIDHGRVVGMQGFARDATERRRLEAELQQAQKMEAVGRLAGGVAHDFNNILTVVTGCAQVALEQTRDPEVTRLLREIGGAADRAAALTRQLLAFSRKQVVEPRAVDLAALLRRTESMLRRLIGEDVLLEVSHTTAAVSTWADPGQVEQVLLNLAVNARDAMPHGGTIRIALSRLAVAAPPEGTAPGDFGVVEVADEGVGIPDDVLPRIFDPFFTTKEFGAGTGLGLATVYGILRQAGGWVDVDTTPGGGTRFRAFFPLLEVEPEPLAAAPADDAVPRGTERILVVEDEVAVRTLVRHVLERLGYRVLEAGNGIEGLRVLAAQPLGVELVLSDVVMPGMSGPEFLARCRTRWPGCRLALMSGYAADRLAPTPERPGYPILEKPFEPAQLARLVRALLDER